MEFLRKKFKIGKVELEAWQLYLGIVASILGIIAFFKKPSSNSETPYSLNITPAENPNSSGSSSSSDYGQSASTDTSVITSVNTALSDLNNSLNQNFSYQNQVLSGITATVSAFKSPEVTTTDIVKTTDANNEIFKATTLNSAPVVPPENHDTTAVVPTAGDQKILTIPAVIQYTPDPVLEKVRETVPVKTASETIKAVAISPSVPENSVVGVSITNPTTGTLSTPTIESRNTTSGPIITSTGRYTRSGKELAE